MILVAIGANLPDRHGAQPLVACLAAVESLRGLAGLRVVAVSAWHRTTPVPASDQPDFCNGVVRLEGDCAPGWLMDRLHRIEAQAGRVRGERNAARVLDLDLIDLNGRVTTGPVKLPHPRAHARAFVLAPLAEVAPDWIHPVLRVGVAALLDAVGGRP